MASNSKTKLLRFKVINFRSIEESDWIDIGDNSCLVGTNEAGKTNLLVALWKLNPANNESIRPLADFPRHLYSKYKAGGHSKDVFIQADFELDEKLQLQISKELSCDPEQVRVALVQRMYDGTYYISLPYSKIASYPKYRILLLVKQFTDSLKQNEVFSKESPELKEKILKILSELLLDSAYENLSEDDLVKLISKVDHLISSEFGKKQNLPALFQKELLAPLAKIMDSFKGTAIATTTEIRQLILRSIPKFVYYSDYGNLDSEIFLPRVIEDMERTDLTESARAKARTLDVLFKYVSLSPKEIYELGNDTRTIIEKRNYNDVLISSEEQEISPEEVALLYEWSLGGK